MPNKDFQMRDEDDQLYIYKLYGLTKARKIKAEKTLRVKIGASASITDKQIEKAQEIIDRATVDFKPFAYEMIGIIEGNVEYMQLMSYGREEEYETFLVPFIQLKGQAAMFGNTFVSDLSQVILSFLDKNRRLDDTSLEIVKAYCKSARVAYEKDIDTLQSNNGRTLYTELQYAIKRYEDRLKV